jgi:hypothetical protein
MAVLVGVFCGVWVWELVRVGVAPPAVGVTVRDGVGVDVLGGQSLGGAGQPDWFARA